MSSSPYIFTYVNDQDIESFLENSSNYSYQIAFLGSSGLISTHDQIYGDAISKETMSYINDKFETSYSYIIDLNYSMNETSYVINKAIINLNDRISDTDARLETAGVWEKGTGTNAVQTKNANNIASGMNSVAEGGYTQASGYYSHSEGYNTEASGDCSHSEGVYTQASGYYSHSEGYNTEAFNEAEHASGVYNKSNTNTLFSVGNGHYNDDNDEEVRQNAFEIMRNGDMYIYGVNKYDGKSISSNKTVQNYLANIDKTISDLSFLTEAEVESIFIDNIIINIYDEDRMIIFGKLTRNVFDNGLLTGEQHLYIGVPHGTDLADIDIKLYRYSKVVNRNYDQNRDISNRTKYKGLHEIWNGGPGNGELAITPVFVDKTTIDFQQNNYDYYEIGGYCEWDDITYDNFKEYCVNTETENKVGSSNRNLYIWELLRHKHNYLCLVQDNKIISGFIPINCNYNDNDDSVSLKL